jgi:hypothetical protein
MKKFLIIGIAGVMGVSSANAGWFSDLFSGSESKPETLAQACNKDDLMAICPDVILGDKTLVDCLMENITSVSKKCSTYIKDSYSENKTALIAELTEMYVTAKGTVTDKVDAADADASAKKAEAVASAKEAAAALKETADSAVATGSALKGLFQ